MKNYYEILQVDKNATSEVINRVYKYHVKKNHPDLFKGQEKEKAKKRVQEFNEAYETLSKKEKRKEYDEQLQSENQNNETETVYDSIKRLEEENDMLKEQLMYKDRVLKNVLNELNIPYAEELQFDYTIQQKEQQEQYNRNKNSINNVLSKYIAKFENKIILIIFTIILILLFVFILSQVTGSSYLDFFQSLF